jgi:deoxyribodipyrimidine photolyase-related protein
MRPSEEYLARKIEKYILPIPIVQVPNTQFLISPEEFRSTYEHPPVMETFYRYMRKTRNILLEDTGKPVGGKWNYDSENQKWDKKHIPSWQPPVYTDQHIQYVAQAKAYYKTIYPQDTYRDVPIDFPTTRTDALALLDYFLDYHYVEFGRLEDAMYTHDILVHHSYISTALNF